MQYKLRQHTATSLEFPEYQKHLTTYPQTFWYGDASAWNCPYSLRQFLTPSNEQFPAGVGTGSGQYSVRRLLIYPIVLEREV